MKKPALYFTLTAIGAFFTVAAEAGTPYDAQLTCPVGGESFTHTYTGSSSTWGSRPDGKPYGSWSFPIPIPECPSNRLVMFREFEDYEIEKLSTLIQSDKYIAMHRETTYYRAQLLADQLTEGVQLPWLLMRAIWQTDNQPEQRRAYLAEFAERARIIPDDPTDFESAYLRFLSANAHRELGRFDDALATVKSIKIKGNAQADDEWRWLAKRLPLLEEVITSQNSDIEPLRLIPDTVAQWKCESWEEAGRTDIDPYCATVTNRQAEVDESDLREATAADREANMEAAEDAMEEMGAIEDEAEISNRTD